MKVVHSGSLDVKSGGPALSMGLTLRGLQNCGVEVVGISEAIESGSVSSVNDIKTIYTHIPRYGSFGYVDNINDCIRRAGEADLYHIHGTWMHHGLAVALYARKREKPYVVTPRGMLYPQALAHHALPKKIFMALYQGSIFRNASCVQATCLEEYDYYRKLGFKNPVAVIPNPIDTRDIIDRPIPEKPNFKIGYLGRVHPRKRIERLIYAMAQVPELTNAELIIIGADDEKYMQFLKDETNRLGLSNVNFRGFLSGKEKDDAIMSLSVLAVPSDFENFGNIVTEALVRGVPVISSTGTPWQELPAHNCGWWVANDQTTINSTLASAARLPYDELRKMGLNGKRLIQQKYSVEILGLKMKQLYEWILEKATPPEFVYVK